MSGHVVCCGKHGATVKTEDGEHHKVHWERVLGHKQRAAAKWEKVRGITGDMTDYVPWDVMRERFPDDINAAREAHHAQRAKKAIAEAAKEDRDLIWLSLDEFAASKESYVERAGNRATVLFAALKDGQWVERGEMGWWGCVSDEKDRNEWDKSFNEMLDALPEDSWLTIVDCHI